MDQLIVLDKLEKQMIMNDGRFHCKSPSSLSQILRFKRNNLRAMEIRNYAMNFLGGFYVTYSGKSKNNNNEENSVTTGEAL